MSYKMGNYHFPVVLTAMALITQPLLSQGWVEEDSIKLKKLLQSDKEIKINDEALQDLHFSFSPSMNNKQDFYLYDIDLQKITPVFESASNNLKVPLIRKMTMPQLSNFSLPVSNGIVVNDFYNSKHLGRKFDLKSKFSFPQHTYKAIKNNTTLDYNLRKILKVSLMSEYNLNNRNNPLLDGSIYRTGVGAGFSIQLNKKIQLNAGMHYYFNAVTGRWEWIYLSGIVYRF